MMPGIVASGQLAAGRPSGDPYYIDTELLQHFQGANDATTFPDESYMARTATAQGDAKLTTATVDWGVSSLVLDGTGDYFTLPNSGQEWQFLHDGSQWTWEGRVRIPTGSGRATLVATVPATSDGLGVWVEINVARQLHVIVARGVSGEALLNYTSEAAFPNDNDFHHLVLEWTPGDASTGSAFAWGVDGLRQAIVARADFTRSRAQNSALFYTGRAVSNTTLDMVGNLSFQRLTSNRARYNLLHKLTYAVPSMPAPTTQRAGYGARSFGKRTLVDTASGSSQYESEPRLVEANDGAIICAYRRGASHVDNTGYIACRRSTTNGLRWGAEIVIADEATYDTRNPVLGKDPASGRLIAFYRTLNATGSVHQATYFRTSTDHGVTWSSNTDISASLSAGAVPFGPIVATTNGLMALFYSADFCEALFSTDGGQTWGSRTTVYDVTGTAPGYNEPWVVATSLDDLVLAARVDATANDEFAFYQSDDGGSTWALLGVVDYSSGGNLDFAAPLSMVRNAAGDIVTVWVARTSDNRLFKKVLTAVQFAADPTDAIDRTAAVAHAAVEDMFQRNYSATTADPSDSGYPHLLQTSAGNLLCAWYDTATGTDTRTAIYIRSIE